MNEIRILLENAVEPVPSLRQKHWFENNFYGFVHFGVNTFTDREWGLGNEDPGIFNPTKLDCDQWVNAARSAGMSALILTAKHHDGFCLWPSRYTEHSVKNSPYKGGKGDIVRELSDACRRGGIGFGVYLSPWDRNSALYGTDAYNDYYVDQLTELLTGYGDIFMVWFDGACGEGPNGKKQIYDFDRYISTVRKYQPDACIFNDRGPDVRWIGNESGIARFEEWAVVPSELTSFADVQTGKMPLHSKGALDYMYNTQPSLGGLAELMRSKGLCFVPAETDMSIRNGWFYHANEEPHSFERLKNTYLTSVCGNSALNLNIPPNREGLFDEKDVKRLAELGNWIKKAFGCEINCTVDEKKSENGALYTLGLPQTEDIGYIELREDLDYGQRIQSLTVGWKDDSGVWRDEIFATTVGNKRAVYIGHRTDALRVNITFARAMPHMRSVKVFRTEE